MSEGSREINVSNTFVQDHLVAEDFNFNGAPCAFDQSGEDLAHGLATGLDIHRAHTKDDGFRIGLDMPVCWSVACWGGVGLKRTLGRGRGRCPSTSPSTRGNLNG